MSNKVVVRTFDTSHIVEASQLDVKEGLLICLDENEELTLVVQIAHIEYIKPYTQDGEVIIV